MKMKKHLNGWKQLSPAGRAWDYKVLLWHDPRGAKFLTFKLEK